MNRSARTNISSSRTDKGSAGAARSNRARSQGTGRQSAPARSAKAGDWLWLPAGSREEALSFATDSLLLVNHYGPALYGASDLMDWRSVQSLSEQA